jgi:hypothetical protein
MYLLDEGKRRTGMTVYCIEIILLVMTILKLVMKGQEKLIEWAVLENQRLLRSHFSVLNSRG